MDTQVLHNTVEQAGHRLTQTRQAVLRLIAQWPEGFTAEELSSELPSVGRATVYRTVKLLLDLGLVCKMARPDGSPRYTLASRGHHHHAICVRCGAVADFQQCTVDTIRQALQTETVGVVLGHRIEVYVLCPPLLGGGTGHLHQRGRAGLLLDLLDDAIGSMAGTKNETEYQEARDR